MEDDYLVVSLSAWEDDVIFYNNKESEEIEPQKNKLACLKHSVFLAPVKPTPFEFCKNGGTLEKDGCVCPEQWKGQRCTIVNFCKNSTDNNFHFDIITVGKYGPSIETCEDNTSNAGFPKATRFCNITIYGDITLGNVSEVNCNQNLETLAAQVCVTPCLLESLEDGIPPSLEISPCLGFPVLCDCCPSPFTILHKQSPKWGGDFPLDVVMVESNTTDDYTEISSKTLALTSNTNQLTAQNISYATTVVQQIFNESKNVPSEVRLPGVHKQKYKPPLAKKVAVATVSQLLDAKEDIFENVGSFGTLTKEIENYSLTLMNESIVQPNIAVQSVDLSTKDPVTVIFSVRRGVNDILDPQQTHIGINETELKPESQTELQILINTTQGTNKKFGFVLYQNNKFFQSKIFTMKSNFSQRIVAGKVSDDDTNSSMMKEVPNVSVEMIFKSKYNESQFQLQSYACVFWNFTKDDWDTSGCKKKPQNNSQFLGCQCNHTTNFAVLMSFRNNYNYPELDILSDIGCGLSIAGLAFSIIFYVVTRKQRKTSITYVFVSLFTCLLIFNILFLFGIENSNKKNNSTMNATRDNVIPQHDNGPPKNHLCTAIAFFLHYFLLATFIWAGLNGVQLYFLLIRTMKPLPRHIILFLTLTGWGVPALVASLTVGIFYPLKGELGYRQEVICWLALPENGNFGESPWFWSFILPVAIILFINMTVFIFITVKVLWGRNENLTSTKKNSALKKILSTISIAVIFGLTWILGYLMLIDNNNIIFNYLFCIFNTTQGLQIFFFYTARTKIFKDKISNMFKSMSSAFGRIKMPSLHSEVYVLLRSFPTRIEQFRLLESSKFTQKTFHSESSQINLCN
ncbi:adhesion G-protein coupled receptor G7 [Monodelphis domestica]|uniref:adhesion G-protein coupled receptor G7 n=1 Tax=Monodelphis domestica TaxID=13616 RepID=UPI0024E1A9E1|nr:adhesion G-protein coupled receptor G7 [Monodelphis domestica]